MDKLQLTKLVEEGSTHREIAQKMNCAQSTIRYWMNKYDLKSKNFKIGDKEFYSTDRFLNMSRLGSNRDLSYIQSLYDSGLSWREVCEIAKISWGAVRKRILNEELKTRTASESIKLSKKTKPCTHTEESRKKISEARKKWLAENPDKHPWKSNAKFKSKPCEKVKEFLKSFNINFIEEFDPSIEGRSFSIDIAIPDKKIALEINGNQHYERTGELKFYYKERNDLLENNGWTVYQIHYAACFDLDKWKDFISQLENSPKKVEFDYFSYTPRKTKEWFCSSCGVNVKRNCKKCVNCKLIKIKKEIKENSISNSKYCISCGVKHRSKLDFCRKCKPNIELKNICNCGEYKHQHAKQCSKCASLKMRKVGRPSEEELEKLILEMPLTKIGKQFGVSDNAVRKWCKNYGITNLPNNSYRQKVFHNKK